MSQYPTSAGSPGGLWPRGTSMDSMSALLARNWWAMALRGAFAILFGLIAIFLPFATIEGLVLVFAIYMLADGIMAMVAGLRAAAHHERWALLILEGVVNLLAGAVAMAMPGLTVLVLVVVLGIWSVVTGAMLLAAAFRLHGGHGRWWLALSGLVSILWGVALNIAPIAGALVLTWWLGGYALVFGVVLLVLAFRLRSQRTLALPSASSPI
jgi:uncharacterized membrane protein HdeD (DUF308 family)